MKKFVLILIASIMLLSLGACSGSGEKKGTAEPLYTVDAATVDPNIYPDEYPLIATADFEKAFAELNAANAKGEIKTYKDIVDIFKVDGAYYKNADYKDGDETYNYYGWYGESDMNLIVTFKVDKNNLNFYAYVSNGIN